MDNGSGADFDVVSDRDAPDQDGARADETAVADFRRAPIDFADRHILIEAAISPNARKPGDKNAMQAMGKPRPPIKFCLYPDISAVTVRNRCV